MKELKKEEYFHIMKYLNGVEYLHIIKELMWKEYSYIIKGRGIFLYSIHLNFNKTTLNFLNIKTRRRQFVASAIYKFCYQRQYIGSYQYFMRGLGYFPI